MSQQAEGKKRTRFKVDARLVFIALLASVAFSSYLAYSTFVTASVAYGKLSADLLLGCCIGIGVGGVVYLGDYWGETFEANMPFIMRERPTVARIRESYSTKFISSHRRLADAAQGGAIGLRKDITEAGIAASPYELVSRSIFFALVAAFIAIPGSIVLTVVLRSPLFLGIAVVPAIILAFPRVRLKSLRGDRNRRLEDEMPFFVTYAAIMQMVGLSLYNSFMNIIGRGAFRQIEQDALLIKRDAIFFEEDPVSALEAIGRTHPNEKMKTLLLGYTSVWRSGGDMTSYLEAKASDYLHDMRFRWQKYANSTSDIGEMMVSLFFVLPILILTAMFVMPSAMASMMSLLTIVVIPTLITATLMAVSAAQPKTGDEISGNWKGAVVAGGLAGLVTLPLDQPWVSLAAAVIGATALYGLSVTLQLKEIRMVEGALPQFVRDLTEYMKMGYDMQKALAKIAKENRYNRLFDAYVRAVVRHLDLGLSMGEIRITLRSSLANTVFFLLSEVLESGGGSPAALEGLSNFINEVNRIKSETKTLMRMYDVLTYATPLGLAFAMTIMTVLLTSFSSTLGTSAAAMGGLFSGTISPAAVQISDLLVVIASAGVAVIGGKAIDFTSKSTLRVAVNVALAAVSISLVTTYAQGMITGLLGAFHV